MLAGEGKQGRFMMSSVSPQSAWVALSMLFVRRKGQGGSLHSETICKEDFHGDENSPTGQIHVRHMVHQDTDGVKKELTAKHSAQRSMSLIQQSQRIGWAPEIVTRTGARRYSKWNAKTTWSLLETTSNKFVLADPFSRHSQRWSKLGLSTRINGERYGARQWQFVIATLSNNWSAMKSTWLKIFVKCAGHSNDKGFWLVHNCISFTKHFWQTPRIRRYRWQGKARFHLTSRRDFECITIAIFHEMGLALVGG
jgi:hypothetical protein